MENQTESAAASAGAAERDALMGGLFAVGAFGIWGFLPVYFKIMDTVPATEILAHRVLWSVLLVGAFLFAIGRRREVLAVLASRKLVAYMVLSALLISGNWLLFIWAVTHDFMLQGSLGYYINPLINVVLGVFLLSERLSKAQWLAVALTVLGVVNLTVGVGALPWISLTLAFLFGFYGYVRKVVPVGAAPGLLVETLVLLPPALGYLVYLAWTGTGALGSQGLGFDLMLVAAGILTAVPLIFFAAAARRLKYATVGIFQYMTPTIQFLLAVFVYGEAFTDAHKVTFGLIWAALAIYSVDVWRKRRRRV